jgi:hypothetical protein
VLLEQSAKNVGLKSMVLGVDITNYSMPAFFNFTLDNDTFSV